MAHGEITSELRDRRRAFRVNSLHAWTYDLSRTYLAHTSFLRAVRDIIKEDNNRTTPKSRDLNWAMTCYITRQAYMPKILDTLRPLFNNKDHDLQMKSSDPDRVLPDGTLRKGKKRIARFRATTEVRSYFAIHAPWVLIHSAEAHIRRLDLNLEEWSRQTMRLRDIADAASRRETGSAFGIDRTVKDYEQQDREVRDFRLMFKQGRIKNASKLKNKQVCDIFEL